MQAATPARDLTLTLVATLALTVSVFTTLGLGSSPAEAQTAAASPVQGDFVGSLGPLHLKLHIHVAADGTLSGTLDSVDQGAIGIPCSDFRVEGSKFSFAVPAVSGTWSGTIENGGTTLTGTWSQGTPLPLTFTRDTSVGATQPTFVAATQPSAVDGFWLGSLQAGPQSLRIQISVKSDAAGREYCALDSLDQGAFGLACANVMFSGTNFSFDVPVVSGHWSGKLSSDGHSLNGTWSQGGALPLNFERQATLVAPPPPRRVAYDSAMPPVDAASMQMVLDRDLDKALKSGALAPETSAGVAIGVMRHGVRRVFVYGTAKTDSIFEIGSITKTFTGLALAQLVVQGKVRLDQPVRELLPPDTVAKPPGAEITLLDLITQHSGLPRMPDNFRPADPNNPYVDYHATNLYEFVRAHGLEKPANSTFLYSNLGVGLLGQALANRAGSSYAHLVLEEITKPLGMPDTVVSLSQAQQARFIQGHGADHRPAHAWDLDALAGAGALRSTANDMLTYLAANLHPEKRANGHSRDDATLPAAFALSHQLRADALPGMRIAFAWLYQTESGTYWHNGGTGGYSAYAFFNPAGDYAGVVLLNTTLGPAGSFADQLGQHINQRLAGKPAVSLSD
jgi:serine-type D-Ala-D-Ala carboxypeptidase/endopeptidase